MGKKYRKNRVKKNKLKKKLKLGRIAEKRNKQVISLKKSFISDLKFYFFISAAISISLGFWFLISVEISDSINNDILTNLLGWSFGFFTLSISIYALILKFTRSTTISNYIQENIEIKYFVSYFSIIFISVMSFQIYFTLLSIKINFYIISLIAIIPLVILIIMTLITIIFPLLDATTTKKSLKFFEHRINKTKKIFENKLKKEIKHNQSEIEKEKKVIKKKVEKGEIEKNLSRDFLISQMQENIIPIKKTSLTKEMYKIFEKVNIDALNILSEIRDSSEYTDPLIYNKIGSIAVPLYLNYEFVRDNIIVKLKLINEKKIDYNSCLLDFLEGFFIGAIKTPYFDSYMAYSIESIIRLIGEIGYKQMNSRIAMDLFDKTNVLFEKIANEIAPLISKSGKIYGNPLTRMIENICSIIASYRTNDLVIKGVQLFRLKEIIKLKLPLGVKINIFTYYKEIMDTITDVEYGYPIFFSVFEGVFSSILSINNLENPNYEPSKIKDGDVSLENGRYKYHHDSIIYATKYRVELLKWVDDTIEYLFRLYKNYISRKSSEEHLVYYNPYLEQLNRVIVDLVFYINLLPSTDKFDKDFFCNTINKSILNHIMELGKSVMENKETKVNHTFVLALSIVIGNFITLAKNNLDVTSVMENYLENKFGLLTYFGIYLVCLTKTNENNLNIDFDKFCNIIELIKKNFLEETLLFKNFYRGREFISHSIDVREGNWGIIGYQIGSNILYINNICSDVNIINGFILKIKEACNVLEKELNESEQSEEHLKNKESIAEKKSLKKFLNLLPATKKKILNEGFEMIFKKMKKESIIFFDRSLRKWKLDLNKYNEIQDFSNII